MNKDNYKLLERTLKELKSSIDHSPAVDMKTDEGRAILETIIDYQVRIYGLLLQIISTEKICPICNLEESKD